MNAARIPEQAVRLVAEVTRLNYGMSIPRSAFRVSQSLPINGFVRRRLAPTYVGDYDPVGADVSPRTLD